MDIDIKTTFEKLTQTLDWLVETLRNGTWARRLLLGYLHLGSIKWFLTALIGSLPTFRGIALYRIF